MWKIKGRGGEKGNVGEDGGKEEIKETKATYKGGVGY